MLIWLHRGNFHLVISGWMGGCGQFFFKHLFVENFMYTGVNITVYHTMIALYKIFCMFSSIKQVYMVTFFSISHSFNKQVPGNKMSSFQGTEVSNKFQIPKSSSASWH